MADDLLKIAADAENDCSCALWDYPEVLRSAHARIEELEAELSRAMDFVQATIRYAGNGGDDYLAGVARTTLAELTGGKDE